MHHCMPNLCAVKPQITCKKMFSKRHMKRCETILGCRARVAMHRVASDSDVLHTIPCCTKQKAPCALSTIACLCIILCCDSGALAYNK